MMGFNTFGGYMLGWHLHAIFGFMLLIAGIFSVIYAVKFLAKKELATLAIWLVIVAVIGILVTAPMAGRAFGSMMGIYGMTGSNSMSMMKMMNGFSDKNIQDFDSYEDWQEYMFNNMKKYYEDEE